jgi:hypothetical protein
MKALKPFRLRQACCWRHSLGMKPWLCGGARIDAKCARKYISGGGFFGVAWNRRRRQGWPPLVGDLLGPALKAQSSVVYPSREFYERLG